MKKILLDSDNSRVGNSISFVDLDETLFHTYAKVGVYKDGKKVGELDNQQFNTYNLKDGEYFNFDEFRDSTTFNKTSTPIEPMVNKIQRMIQSIIDNGKDEKVIFLTARSDFNDKELFLKTFRQHGINVDIPNVRVERSGNLQHIKGVADRKKHVILQYLASGDFTAVRMYDDDMHNINTFKQLGVEINDGKYGILKAVRNKYPRVNKVLFYPLLVKKDGSIIKESSNNNDSLLNKMKNFTNHHLLENSQEYRKYAGYYNVPTDEFYYLPQGMEHKDLVKTVDDEFIRFDVTIYKGSLVCYVSGDDRKKIMYVIKELDNEFSHLPIEFYMIEYKDNDGSRVFMNMDRSGRQIYENAEKDFPCSITNISNQIKESKKLSK